MVSDVEVGGHKRSNWMGARLEIRLVGISIYSCMDILYKVQDLAARLGATPYCKSTGEIPP